MFTVPAVRTAVTAAALVVLGAGTLRAQRTMDTTLAVRANARFSLSNMSGNITVNPWNRSQIRIQAESEGARVEVSESPSGVSVRTSSRGSHGDVEFIISVPVGTALELHGMSSDVDVTRVCGQVDINTLSGDIQVDCVEGGAQIESSDVTAEVVSGDVEYTGRILDNGRYKLSAHSGDVTVRTPGSPSATVSIETFSGDFESDFQIALVPGQHLSSKNYEFRLGSGSARVQLSSFSGTIALRRMGAGGPREE